MPFLGGASLSGGATNRAVESGPTTPSGLGLRPRVLFVMEQHLGHRTYYENLRASVESRGDLWATWAPIAYGPAKASWESWSSLPASWRGALRGRHEVTRALDREAVAAFFFNTHAPAVLGGRATRRRPYVIASDLTPFQFDQIRGDYGHRPARFWPLRPLKHHLNARVLRGACLLLPWSQWAARSLIEDYQVPPERVVVFPPSVDLELWHPGERNSHGPVRLLFVGGDLWRKGGAALLEVFRGLPPGLAELVLVTRSSVSPPPGVLALHDLEPNDPRLLALFRSSDVFVLPTGADAYGIAAVEACASGLPVIASSVGGLGDVVDPGESGFLIDPGDVQALARSIHMLATNRDLRRRMGRASRLRAEARFDARANAGRLSDLLCRFVPIGGRRLGGN